MIGIDIWQEEHSLIFDNQTLIKQQKGGGGRLRPLFTVEK